MPDVPGQVRLRERAATAAWLSALFLVVYGGCNWGPSLRHDVGTWAYDWERGIPFVAWTIVPYMSIDAFFVAAPFLCADRVELGTLRRRITLALVVAAAFFLAVPLRFSFQRPHATGF